MAEKTVDKVMRLMTQKDRIRNICTSAHIDHGKCVSAKTRLMLSDGCIKTAEELFDFAKKNGKIVEGNEEQTIYDISESKIKVFSLNKSTGRLEKKQIKYAWKLKGGSAIKIRLRNGFEIATTPEHKYIVLENLEFIEKEAHQLKLGDRIVCARKLDVETSVDLKKEILERLANGRFYARLKSDFGNEFKAKIVSFGLEKVRLKTGTSLERKSFYHEVWQNRYLLSDLLKLAKLFGIDTGELYENIDAIVYGSGAQHEKSSYWISLPRNFEDLFYLGGLFMGDGSGNKFVVRKEHLGKRFVKLCNELGIKPKFRNYAEKTLEICTNETVVQMLNMLFDYPIKKKSHNLKISEFVFKAPKACIASLIRGYFDCDGTVEKSRRAISISSASTQMIKDLSLLLLRFGCLPVVHKNTIYLTGESAVRFVSEVGFTLPENMQSVSIVSQSTVGSYVCDTIPLSTAKLSSLRNEIAMTRLGHHYYKYEGLLLTPTIRTFSKILEVIPKEGVNTLLISKLCSEELAYIEVASIESAYEDVVYDFTIPDNHNFVAEGMIIHNTTFSDNLLYGAGMMSEELAGKACVLDFHEDEQKRGITIDAANVSMVHEFEGEEYLINLIDTPGHVDFGGDVTRAMRAIDGTILLVDCVEGVMPQTETVLRQALRERVKPVLFINKVDRLIKELQLSSEKMHERFMKIIAHVNRLIKQIAEPEFGEKWQVDVSNGSVAFGSAFAKWALSFPYMKKTNITFKDVIDAYQSGEEERIKELSRKAPLHRVVLDMVIKHHPTPVEAQKYRIPKIWRGDFESKEGQALLSCDHNGPMVFVITKIVVDPHAGEVCAGRLFSGTLKKGDIVYLNRAKQSVRVQQVSVYNGPKRELVEAATAGNVIGVVGLKGGMPGETVSIEPMEPFEQITHIFEPVVTKAIEAKKPSDLPKLIEVLRQVHKEDPTIKIEINEETGEHLMHGMGELHLEIVENRIRSEKGVDVQTSPPIVVYRETVTKESPVAEGKSPNKHNKFYFIVAPLEDSIFQAIKKGEIPKDVRLKKKEMEIWQALERAGMSSKESRQVRSILNGNIFLDLTKGEVHIGEVIEMVMDGFEDVMNRGPLAREPCTKVKVSMVDIKLHEDAIHRGPAQVLPAVREGIREAFMNSRPLLLEPLQILEIEAPVQYMGDISKLIQNKRGQLQNMEQEGEIVKITAKMPVVEMFGLTSDLRSATEGRGVFFVVDQLFERLPDELQEKTINQIRQRKGEAGLR